MLLLNNLHYFYNNLLMKNELRHAFINMENPIKAQFNSIIEEECILIIKLIPLLLKEFYFSLSQLLFVSIPELKEEMEKNPSNEILLNTDNCELATYDSKRNKYNYPKANKIYKNCLRILIKVYFYINKNVFKFHEKMITSQIKNRSTKKKKMKKPKKALSKQTTLKSNMISNSKVNEVQNKLKSAIKAEII